jgi:hypothetical protein
MHQIYLFHEKACTRRHHHHVLFVPLVCYLCAKHVNFTIYVQNMLIILSHFILLLFVYMKALCATNTKYSIAETEN